MGRNIETKADAEDWIAAIDRNAEGIEALSSGPCPGCEECGEGSFSWSSCDLCHGGLGGSRYPAHGFMTLEGGEEELLHLDVCTDCYFYLANGPDDRISDLLAG